MATSLKTFLATKGLPDEVFNVVNKRPFRFSSVRQWAFGFADKAELRLRLIQGDATIKALTDDNYGLQADITAAWSDATDLMDKDAKRTRENQPAEDLDAPLDDDSLMGLMKYFVGPSRFRIPPGLIGTNTRLARCHRACCSAPFATRRAAPHVLPPDRPQTDGAC